MYFKTDLIKNEINLQVQYMYVLGHFFFWPADLHWVDIEIYLTIWLQKQKNRKSLDI